MEATAYLNRHGIAHPDIQVTTPENCTNLYSYCQEQDIDLPPAVQFEPRSEFYLGNGLFVAVHTTSVDIFQRDYETQTRKNGVLLDIPSWEKFVSMIPNFSTNLTDISAGRPVNIAMNIYSDVYITLRAPYPVLRMSVWSEYGGRQLPENGIVLRSQELQHLSNISHLIERSYTCLQNSQN